MPPGAPGGNIRCVYMKFFEINGTMIGEVPSTGPQLVREQDAVDIIGGTFGSGATLIAIPVDRLAQGFFDLKTRVAGGFIQKFVNYQMRVAFVGDLEAQIAASGALQDYVFESNKGKQVTFVASMAELEARLR